MMQVYQLLEINQKLTKIEDYQRMIAYEMQEANKTLNKIQTSLHEIQKTNEQIAINTEISAIANQQTAAATQWMAWHAHFN